CHARDYKRARCRPAPAAAITAQRRRGFDGFRVVADRLRTLPLQRAGSWGAGPNETRRETMKLLAFCAAAVVAGLALTSPPTTPPTAKPAPAQVIAASPFRGAILYDVTAS